MGMIVIVLLGFGLLPIIIEPFNLKVSVNDSPQLIRYKMGLIGVRVVDVARSLFLSESYVQANISGLKENKKSEIINFINKSIS